MKEEDIVLFLKKLSNKMNKTEAGIEFILTKNQLINPHLKEAFEKGYFSRLANLGIIKFKCVDTDLFFNEDESEKLLSNYEAIKSAKSDLIFDESISGFVDWDTYKGKLTKFDVETKKISRSFLEVMEINKKLTSIANIINNELKQKLSPFEKYLLCYKIVQNIEYYCTKEKNDASHSFIDTVKLNKGCCLGKSQYLRALLYMVGIDSCACAVNTDVEDIIKFQNLVENGFKNSYVCINGVEEPILITDAIKILQKRSSDKNLLRVSHIINLVNIIDPEYNMKGILACDVTSKGMPNDACFSISGQIDKLLNFKGLYVSGEEICEFIKKCSFNSEEKLTEQDEEGIEEEYLDFAKKMIISDLQSMSDQDSNFEKAKKKFLSKLGKCDNFFEMKTLFDDKRFIEEGFKMKQKENAKGFEEMFEKFLNNENEHLIRTLTAIDARIQLENSPQAECLPYTTYSEVDKKIDEIYKEYFTGKMQEEKTM